ncbi:protein-S-isoprenylcysteine O-methyltransferase Ste14 [Sphingobium sp. B11D3B]|uniref:methyltransferase family protein n=1 Tax=Sphingobium sp. B11D3B TaxID=2940575 RepID=UPI0022260524|nr:methyltransferase [Sphingobium sp. B11D3B]MCW2389596.1 protein-S-isoprenylcysteine O-methyltransferase Ste14 [Sphingobium sp. B11D3B]
MIDVDLPAPMMWALRWLLFLGPVGAVLVMAHANRTDQRKIVGGLFSFLYGFAMIFVTHQLALDLGWWRYGGKVLMVMGMPADIWIGGALLFGPVMYFAFPTVKPLFLVLPIIIGLHGTIFSSLSPLVEAGPYWFPGVILVFLVAHIPAIYLARWTAREENLPGRAALLAVGYGFLAFLVLPSLIMHAMGGSWDIVDRPASLIALCLPLLGLCFVVGLSAVQMFVLHGEGTPIPLDKTKRLVRTGLFAYVINPMQISTALAWIVMGLALGNIWVASASVMAWVFVAGMVRWHHRNDLLVRFPEGWPIYRANVPEWWPRWRPWIPKPATLRYDPEDPRQMRLVRWLEKRQAQGLQFRPEAGSPFRYTEPDETVGFDGSAAVAKAVNHIHFLWALTGAAMLLPILAMRYMATSREKLASVELADHG